MNRFVAHIEHGDWYGDQESHNLDNYYALRILQSETTGNYSLTRISLYGEFHDGGYSLSEVIDKAKACLDRKCAEFGWSYSEFVVETTKFTSDELVVALMELFN